MTRYDPHPQAHDDARSTPHGFTGADLSDFQAPEAPVGEVAAERLPEPRTVIADDGEGEPTLWVDLGIRGLVPVLRRCDMRPATRHLWPLVPAVQGDAAIVEQRPLVDSLIEARRQRDAAEARARVCREDVEQNAERAEVAEARARRAEDALRRMTATARCVLGDNRIESDADLGNYPDPNLAELWLDVKHADRALAGQTSDATPSAACTTCGQPPDAPACSKSLDGGISGHTFAGGTKASDAGERGE